MLKNLKNRHAPIVWTLILATGLLIYKTAEIQLFDATYKTLAQKTILDKKVVYPSRGLIYDRYKQLMTVNKPIYEIRVVFRNIDPDMDTALFCQLLNITKDEFEFHLDKNWSSPRFHKAIPFTFLSRVKPEVFSRFQEHMYRFPGFFPITRNIRAYPHQSASHILGYLGEVNNEDIQAAASYYKKGDYIGRSGLEKQYEHILRGDKGIEYVVRDNLGREISSFNNRQLDSTAVAGIDLYTTMDLGLQAYAESLMDKKRGSIVAIQPATGEILAALSAPNYDPNMLNLDEDRGPSFKVLLNDTVNKPFLDRTVAAKYPPGSIFKPILSLIALQEGVFEANRTIYCNGYYQYKSFKYGCHDHEPTYNLPLAIKNSCNSYFFQMIREMLEIEDYTKPEIGLNILNGHLRDFSLGRKLGIDHTNEHTGFIPTPAFYDNLYRDAGAEWRSTYVMSIGIGQGELELTTLQMANLAAIIANRGFYFTPHLVKSFSNRTVQQDPVYNIRNEVRIDKAHFEPVVEGMRQAVRRGTAYLAEAGQLEICGKTGTSQNPFGEDHSVFFAFAPRENPEIAIAVYVENAGFGGNIAAPIGSLIIEKYINKKVQRKQLEAKMKSTQLIKTPQT